MVLVSLTYDLHRESYTIVECASFQWKTKPIFNIFSTSNENKLLKCRWSHWGDSPAYNRWPWLGLLCDLSLTLTNPYSLILDNSTFEWPLDSNKPIILGGVSDCGGVFIMELDGSMLINHKFSMPSLPSSVGESALLLSNPLVTGGGDRFACRCVCVSHSSSWCTNVGCWHVLLVCGIDGRLCAQLAAAVWDAAAADWCCGVVTLPLARLW